MKSANFEPVIGLEIHVELKTKSKMFCGCDAFHFGKKANTLTCPVCLGLPGGMPVPNEKAIEWTRILGLALNCQISQISKFDRKNYFYPDLPKGFQISQYDKPFAYKGWIKFNQEKILRIRRVHLEEDTGKLLHKKIDGAQVSLIDFNRSGVPLTEIVTEPDLRSSEEAKIFLQKLQLLIRYLGISDADMEKGSMRLEPNISVRRIQNNDNKNDKLPDYKVEVKNINSFNFVKKAIDYEINRQIDLLSKGIKPAQETRGWDESKNLTYLQRSKEEAQDYRYFFEPDIPQLVCDSELIAKLKSTLPELPDKIRERYLMKYKIKRSDADILIESQLQTDYFEECIDIVRLQKEEGITPQIIANWIVNRKVKLSETSPKELIKLIQNQQKNTLINSEFLKTVIKKIIVDNTKAVADYKNGKVQVLAFLVGQVLRETRGKGKPEEIRKLLIEKLTDKSV